VVEDRKYEVAGDRRDKVVGDRKYKVTGDRRDEVREYKKKLPKEELL
jgi:hypothetical protein